jgi:hypothetical protein
MQPLQNQELVANGTWTDFSLEGAAQQLEPAGALSFQPVSKSKITILKFSIQTA